LKELLERLVTLVPAYFADLVQFTAGPKRFLTKRTRTWNDGLTFLAISFLLTFIVQLPLSRTDPLLDAATSAAFVLFYVVLYGYAVLLSWRAVGGTAPIERFFAIHFYVAGVLKLILSAVFMTAMGLIRMGDPSAYEEMNNAIYSGNVLWFVTNAERFAYQPVWQMAGALAVIGVLAMLAWILTIWGAYREVNRLSKTRSAVAFVIFCAACVPIYIVTSIIANALVVDGRPQEGIKRQAAVTAVSSLS
jgi:hypothetical protein